MSATITLTNDIAEVQRLKTFFAEYAQEHDFSQELILDMNLVFEEVVSNIIFYGYNERTKQPRIEIDIQHEPETLTIVISDDATPFNILEAPEPDLDIPFEEREIGGMGIHLVKTLMDELEYARIDGRNVLTMRKSLVPLRRNKNKKTYT